MGSNPIPSAILRPPFRYSRPRHSAAAAPILPAAGYKFMNSYHIWTIGCQMNTADSERLGSALEQLGLQPVEQPADADVVVLNSCVVRQSAEDKVVGNLGMMARLKRRNPLRVVALMGCMVGPQAAPLERRFPYVDVFMRPQQFAPLLALVGERQDLDWEGCIGQLAPMRPEVACNVPIIQGCDLMCAFCIIPYRRGRQVSRPLEEVAREVELLVARGVQEVTVLGQTVDAYGHDRPGEGDLADLLARLDAVDGLQRVRFLTSHPAYMSERIIRAVAELPKVCEHINLPVQAGDDEVLRQMRRGYTRREYAELVQRIRDSVPGASLSTDVIVGFPGETEAQFRQTLALVEELRFDKVHCAAYSTRPGTIAQRQMADDVPAADKTARRRRIDEAQERILTEINAELVGQRFEVLVEGQKRGRWQGRTRANKLVFFDDPGDWQGRLAEVEIRRASPWSLQGALTAANPGVNSATTA